MQHINRIIKLRNIHHAEDARILFDPNLLHSGSNIEHWLEIFRFLPVLHAVKVGIRPRAARPWEISRGPSGSFP